MAEARNTVIITGSSGFIGGSVVRRLRGRFNVVGLDLKPTDDPPSDSFFPIDLSSEASVARTLEQVKARHGRRIASVIHFAACLGASAYMLEAPMAATGAATPWRTMP